MRPGLRRSGLALAGLALGGIWIAATGWLDREAETGRTLAIAAPEHGQTVLAGAQAYLDVRAEARGLGAGCVLYASDHVDTWRRPIGKAAGARELNERFGPLRGHGERLAWLDLECPEGPPTAQRRARRVTVSAPPAPRAEIVRFHFRIASVQSWISRELGPKIELKIESQSGKIIQDKDQKGAWIEYEKIDADNVRLYALNSGGVALAADLEITIDFRELGDFWLLGDYWVKGRLRLKSRVTLPFAITGFDDSRGWTVEAGKILVAGGGSLKVDYTKCDDPKWIHRKVCQSIDAVTLGGVARGVYSKAEKRLKDKLSCRETECLSKQAETHIEDGLDKGTQFIVDRAGPTVATLLGDDSLLSNLEGLAQEMNLGLSRVTITDNGRGIDASVSVDSAWLGAHTPKLYTPRRALSNEGSLVVSFVALNRMLERLLDRPFCTEVAPELQRLGLLGSNKESTRDVCAAFTAELLGGEGTLLGWTGLVHDPDFSLQLKVRPLGRDQIEFYVADARPFAPVGHTAMGVFARLARTLERRVGGKWTLSSRGRPGSTLGVVLEAMPTGKEPASERVRARYDSLAQLIDPRPGAATPAWLSVKQARDREAFGDKIANIAAIDIDERRLKLGDWRLTNPQITLLSELNALHASGDIAIE